MTDECKRCGTCARWKATIAHGGYGGKRLSCSSEMEEWHDRYPDAKGYSLSDIEYGYGSRHPCHRPYDYELASAYEMDYRVATKLVSTRDISGR